MWTKTKIIEILESVCDPEIPVLSITDLGIIRDIIIQDKNVEVIITPTYSGCPAMDMIAVNIKAGLEAAGIFNVKVSSVLSPAWTTDWITQRGRERLKAYGIAPPVEENPDKMALFAETHQVPCPQCDSSNTKMLSQFGSTACKSMYQCQDCREPFDYFKCHK